MIAGLFGLGAPEIIALLVLGGCSLAVPVGVIILVVSLTRNKRTPSPEDDD